MGKTVRRNSRKMNGGNAKRNTKRNAKRSNAKRSNRYVGGGKYDLTILFLEFIRDHLNLDDIQFILLGHLSPRTNSEEIIEEQFTKEFGNFDKFIFAPTVDPITIK